MERPTPVSRFATTRWSLIRQRLLPGNRAEVDPGLAHLCQTYWRPIFTFIYRRGYPDADAQDLTQDFFFILPEGKFLDSLVPARARFASLLLASLKNFLFIRPLKRPRI